MESHELEFDFFGETASAPIVPTWGTASDLVGQLAMFREFGTATRREVTRVGLECSEVEVATFVNEFWTARQRQAHSLHEISYRACFKPQLPRFFIQRLTAPGERVYDPFMGRGTTCLETALQGRVPVGCDINPLSIALVRPRMVPPDLNSIASRLRSLPLSPKDAPPEDLLVFYHPETLGALQGLKEYLLNRTAQGELDAIDEWIRMVAINRLTGHSNGFLSVYSLPPNQAVSVQSQRKINERLKQTPPPRDLRKILWKKTVQLLSDLTPAERSVLGQMGSQAQLLTSASESTPSIAPGSISLVVTSPPFLNVVDYQQDNWLRCWFLGIDADTVQVTTPSRVDAWEEAMARVLVELHRVLKPHGHVAFEVGEVRRGKVRLEESVIRCGLASGLEPVCVVINDQKFTKTANCWGVNNNTGGTNTNRIVMFRKPSA